VRGLWFGHLYDERTDIFRTAFAEREEEKFTTEAAEDTKSRKTNGSRTVVTVDLLTLNKRFFLKAPRLRSQLCSLLKLPLGNSLGNSMNQSEVTKSETILL
jgi:hypothetical protein